MGGAAYCLTARPQIVLFLCRVFHGAAVRFCLRSTYGLAGNQGVQGVGDVVDVLFAIRNLAQRRVVNAAVIGNPSLGVYDKDMRGRLGVVFLAHLAGPVVEYRIWELVFLGKFLVCLRGGVAGG